MKYNKKFKDKEKYLIDFAQDNAFHAGTKAREDINTLLKSNGYNYIGIDIRENKSRYFINKVIDKLSYIWQIYEKMCHIHKESIVLMQYPFFSNRTVYLSIKIMCIWKRSSFIVLVHDIESIRRKKGKRAILNEIKLLKLSDYLIVHNYAMKKALLNFDNSFEKKAYELNLFDYVVKDINQVDMPKLVKKVIIAGNLSSEKSPYVYKLNDLNLKNVSIDLYGVNYSDSPKRYIQYKGKFIPENIPFHEGFGLVWDGDSIDTCSGDTGEYMRINNPHKLSLYMAARIPVIVWKESAIAQFVKENNVGFCVDSLYEIEELISNVTEDTYRKLVDNVTVISERVHNGYYILGVLDKIYFDLKKRN